MNGKSLALLACALAACSGGKPRPSPVAVGRPDQPSTDRLTVDEPALRGEVHDGAIKLQIPVANPGAIASRGKLTVAVVGVDGAPTRVSQQVSFDLAPGAKATLAANLELPAAITAQSDWARYNVRVVSPDAQDLQVTRSLLAVVPPYEVRLEGPSRLTRGRKVRYRVRAQDPLSFQLMPGVKVKLALRQKDATVVALEGTTGDKGDVVFDLMPDVDGPVQIEAQAVAQGTTAQVSDDAAVNRPGAKVLLTTDKPLYQPGQVVHLRVLALDGVGGKPAAARAVLLEIQDGKGNRIFKRSVDTDGYGLAAADFTLGSVLNMGTFQIQASVGAGGQDKAQKTVQVGRYVLPKFKIDVGKDRPYYRPGDTIAGTIDARYFFGKPVAGGDVAIEASALDIGASTFQRVMGKTDAQGRYPFSIMVPGSLVGLPLAQGAALVNLAVKVTDTAGQVVEQQAAVTVVSNPLRLALVPEATVLVPGLENKVDLYVTDPLGAPVADAAVTADFGKGVQVGRTDPFGHAGFVVVAGGPGITAAVTAKSKEGVSASETFTLDVQAGATPVLVRTDRAVYAIGDTVSVDITTGPDRRAVYVDWLNNGQVVDMRTLDVTKGAAHLAVPIDATLAGSNRIEAYVVGPDGNIVRGGRTIFTRSGGALTVEVASDQPSYTPGAPAKLTWSVRDESGAPAVAALGVQIVDQAVFALVDAQPGLLRTYFELEEQFAVPHYQLRAPAVDLPSLLFDETAQKDAAAAGAAQTRAASTLAALGASAMMGIADGSWGTVTTQVSQRLAPFYDREKTRLTEPVRRAVQEAVDALSADGCIATQYQCGDGKPYVQSLVERARKTLSITDFWGNLYRQPDGIWGTLVLATSGPDEKAGTGDDGQILFPLAELGVDFGVPTANPSAPPAYAPPPTVAGGAGGSGGAAGGIPPMATPPAQGTGGGAPETPEPRLRTNFPETLYTNPEIITGPDGKASVTLDMADSITDWRVSSLAHTLAGKLGGGAGTVRVFQEFFVDVDFPATLTRGDEVAFPVAVYNYLDQPQTVHLELAPGDWYTPTGGTTQDVALAPGEVKGVRFPVRVDRVGRQSLTVKATGGQRSDAVARSVLVQPDGKLVSLARSGALAAGSVSLPASFPAGAIPGSQRLYVNVFPGYLAQVVQGMDSLLRVPYGCFEQTTSTAWPNVLVTNYLKQTGQLKPEVQLKAESLMSAGYQRLLTFEHRGGGYSWFGDQDPAPFLSVTAFGLMEFADMAKVHPVDEAMVERTKQWLVGKQQADGSWEGDMSEFFTFQTSLLRNTAFVVWALASAGDTGPELARGLGYVKQHLGKEAMDAYSLALVANAILSVSPADPAVGEVFRLLDGLKKVDGEKISWDAGATQTNFYGGGNDSAVASTALVAHALLLAGGDKATVDGALAFLVGSADAQSNFGSTQATIWTLRTLLLAATKGSKGAVGTLDVAVDGQSLPPLALTADQSDVTTTLDLGSMATAGDHQVTLAFAGTGKVSYNLVAEHNLPWATVPGEPPGPLALSIAYDKTRLALDDVATATVSVRNRTARSQAMALVMVGLPPGFEVQTADLDAIVATQALSKYELTGKQLLLYVSSLRPSQTLAIKYRLRAVTPVRASDGGLQAYLYYAPDQRTSAPATTLEVTMP